MSLEDRLRAPGPKRILALDGGGVRGNLSAGILGKLEQVLRQRHGDSKLRLCDYFDLIAGTSTGSLIASMLAIGFDTERLRREYLHLAGRAFSERRWIASRARGALRPKYDVRPLEEELERLFGDRTLGDESILTGLCLVTKRADTGSTWPLINHPGAKYYHRGNSKIPLRQAVRAAGAAPTVFDPADVEFGPDDRGTFIDGAISTANNPSVQAFYVATLQGFPFGWPTGEDKLLLVSVGTGTWHRDSDRQEMLESRGYEWAERIPDQMIEDTNWSNQLLLQYLSKTATPWYIDSEVGFLSSDQLSRPPALTYLRYNAWLEPEALEALDIEEPLANLEVLRDMSNGDGAKSLYRIGRAAAEKDLADEPEKRRRYPILEEHFPRVFDVSLPPA